MTWLIAACSLIAAGLWLWKRGSSNEGIVTSYPPSADRGRDESMPRRTPPPPVPQALRSCPVCHAEYAPKKRFCVRDGAPLIDGSASGPFSQGMICPTCRRGYTADASFCPEDSDELVPYGLYGAASATRPPLDLEGHKICPECGVRHATAHLFCGHDGSELVVVN